jgi:hypothetical protein
VNASSLCSFRVLLGLCLFMQSLKFSDMFELFQVR